MWRDRWRLWPDSDIVLALLPLHFVLQGAFPDFHKSLLRVVAISKELVVHKTEHSFLVLIFFLVLDSVPPLGTGRKFVSSRDRPGEGVRCILTRYVAHWCGGDWDRRTCNRRGLIVQQLAAIV